MSAGLHRAGRPAGGRCRPDRGNRLVRRRAVRRMAVGAAKLGGAQPVGAQPRRRHPGRSDRGAEARSHRRHQRRPRRTTPTRSCRPSPRPSRSPARTPSSNRGRTRPPPSARRCSRYDDMQKLIAGVDDKFTTAGKQQPAVHRQEGAAGAGHVVPRTARSSPRPAGAPTSSLRWASSSPTASTST